ncbi:hypothetical protein QJQ45_001965 [Haematococcus lacustris]|nr:hypothetical protein QJQ45_001965 [Haematococcus lacustris]
MSPKRNRKRAVSPAPSAAGASGSGQQLQGQGQAAKVVIGLRRQVIKAGLRGLVKAPLPDLSPAQPSPAQQQQHFPAAGPAPGPLPHLTQLLRPTSWGRWLDRDTNPCLNFQRIGESMQRPLELYEGLMALPPIGKEYQQGYKLVHDRLPKVKQRLHRAAEYRRALMAGPATMHRP